MQDRAGAVGAQPELQRTARAGQGGGGHDPLRHPGGAQEHVHRALGEGRGDRSREGAALQGVDPGPGVADLVHDAAVPEPVEYGDLHVRHPHALDRGDRAQVLRHRPGDVDGVGAVGAHGQHLHVGGHPRRVQRAVPGHGDRHQRVRYVPGR
ncbi:hypothetical protein Ae168Ps1_0121 [Pseudonocardia sp. Ae168_Ps1]|nr:hypothetical protein Ae168Ps1_0121 [Pseudonocardia sp. Ae168_Ps1]OLL88162.1 hypothetical protein Ae263Ps1_5217c [Pseudonocardia sp. Ae263_Ps1]OLL91811.1 hypothetical protein Ae356Ps1_1708 [Pseudonocardia sp. Ae356_Ps1]